MNKLIILVVGIVIGVIGWRYYERTNHPTISARTKETAVEAREVATAKAKEAGAEMGDARIIAAVKVKYLVDKDLSIFAITVDCADGKVTLSGTASSPELIARAVKLAQDTGGVHSVNSLLTVKN